MTQKAKTGKQPHIPMRSCTGCRQSKPKKELIRVVRTPEGTVEVDDVKGKLNGRGAYVCADVSCFDQAIKKKAFDHVLKMKMTEEQANKVKDGFIARLLADQEENQR